MVAVADTDETVAEEVARDFDIPHWYGSYQQLIDTEQPDLISICTPPTSRGAIAEYAISRGVKAVHCEKPIATSYKEALFMQQLATEAGVQLTVNLQRRYEPVHEYAHDQIAKGVVGELASVEGYCPNLPDWGSHICDLIFYYLDDAPASWVMGQVDVTTKRYIYGALAETSSVTFVQWPSGINATILTGREPRLPRPSLLVRNGLVVNGTKGRIIASGPRCVVHRFGEADLVFESPFSRDETTWERGVDPAITACTTEGIKDLVWALENGKQARLTFAHALAGAELVYATYESSRARCRVDLPLKATDNALLDGLAKGYWQPVGEEHSTY